MTSWVGCGGACSGLLSGLLGVLYHTQPPTCVLAKKRRGAGPFVWYPQYSNYSKIVLVCYWPLSQVRLQILAKLKNGSLRPSSLSSWVFGRSAVRWFWQLQSHNWPCVCADILLWYQICERRQDMELLAPERQRYILACYEPAIVTHRLTMLHAWQCFTLDNASRLTMLHDWQCFALDSAVRLTVLHAWQCFTLDNASRLTMLHAWQCFTLDSASRLTMPHAWQCFTFDSASRLTMLHAWQCFTLDNASRLTVLHAW